MASLALGYHQVARHQGRKSLDDHDPFFDEGTLLSVKRGRLRTYFAVGVNLAFSIELYLKAILAGSGNPKSGHDLLPLYDGLPDKYRVRLEGIYESLSKRKGQDPVFAVTFQQGGGGGEDDDEIFPPENDNSLRSLIKRADKMFVTWRYVHEKTTKVDGTPQAFVLEYYALRRACIAMRKLVRICTPKSN